MTDDMLEVARRNAPIVATTICHANVEGLMCRNIINIGYEGEVFDCDLTQMLRMQQRDGEKGKPLHLWDVTPECMTSNPTLTANHCFGYTAGHGSSCTGGLENFESKSTCHAC